MQKYVMGSTVWINVNGQAFNGTTPKTDSNGRTNGWDLIEKDMNVYKVGLGPGDGDLRSTCVHELGHALGLESF